MTSLVSLWSSGAIAVGALLLTGGCSSSPGGDLDAAARDSAGDAAGTSDTPDIPWLDEGVPPLGIAPCRSGWREVGEGGGITTCDPYPEGGALDCAAGQAHFPGESGCAPVGSACPAGDFSDALPADRRVVYVRPGAIGGDGMSPATAYGGFGEFSFGRLPFGANIALSRGTHTGPVWLGRGTVLRGACAEATVLTASEPSGTAGVVTFVDQGEVSDLSVADSPRPGVWLIGAGAEGVLDGVLVARTEFIGLSVAGNALVTARSTVVRDTRARTLDGAFGRGVSNESAALEMSRVVVERSQEVGVFVTGTGATVALGDAAVRDTQGELAGSRLGDGLSVARGATAALDGIVFERNRNVGLGASEDGTVLSLSDAVIRDTTSQALDRTGGRGLNVQNGATADVTRVVVERSRALGMYFGLGTSARLADAVVRDTVGQESDDNGGRGLNLQAGATLELRRMVLERNREVGVFAGLEGTALMLTDVVVRDTESQASDGTVGRGLSVELGATTELGRGLFERNRDIGVEASGDGSRLTSADVVVRDTRPRACAETTCVDLGAGHGTAGYLGGSHSMTRFHVERSHLCGVLLASGGEVDLVDGVVRDNPIGVCLQVDGYDSDRLRAGVRFADNGVNLQATDLPVPEPLDTVP